MDPEPELVALIASAAAHSGRLAREQGPLPIDPPILGRRRELEAAEATLDVVAAGRLGAMLIRGTAGIGKTRVLAEIGQSARAAGWRVLELRGLERTADTSLAALSAAVAGLDSKAVAELAEPGRSAVLALAPVLDAASRSRRRSRLAFTSDEALRTGLLDALAALSVERPLALIADDLQWLDNATQLLVEVALQALQDRPILVALTIRDEPGMVADSLEAIADRVRARGQELRLGPLAEREVRLLLERELAGGRVGDALLTTIMALSGGAPLFALELLRGAQQSGTIAPRDGVWRMAGPGSRLPVPAGVRRAVEARQARLEPQHRAILALAAELGDEVSFEQLAAAADVDADVVLDALDAGLAVALLVERGPGYRFGHPLFRAALRERIPATARAGLFLRVARALAGGVDPTNQIALAAAVASGIDARSVASHAGMAADLGHDDALPLAVGFGFAAGARQAAVFDFPAAIDSLRAATAHWYRLAAPDRATYPVSAAQVQLGLALKAVGEPVAAEAAFETASTLATTDLDRARGYAAASWLPYEHGRFDRAEAILRAGLEHVAAPEARAFIQAGLGWILGRRGRWAAARELLEEAVPILEAQGAPPDVLSRAMDRWAVTIRDTGEPRRSISAFEQALRLSHEAHNANEESTIRMHLAGALREVGELDLARHECETAIAICRMTGDRYIEAVTKWILAEVEHSAGHLERAIELRLEELDLLQAIGGNPMNEAMAHAHLAHLLRALGDTRQDDAEEHRRRAVDIARHGGIGRLAARVERALAVEEWFDAGPHRSDGNDAGTEGPQPPDP
ncbi:MAG: AAA family ATPase [Chloroflexota bacterium]